MTREELLKICEDAVVKCELWHDRDSCVTQYRLNTIYSFLKVGAEFTTEVDKNQTIWVTVKTTDEIIKLFEKEFQKDFKIINIKDVVCCLSNERGLHITDKKGEIINPPKIVY